MGVVAASSITATAAENNEKTYAPFDVPKGSKQFTYENIINNDINVDDVNNENQTENNNNSNDGTETVTNVEDLFN